MTNKDKATARPWQIASVTSSHMGDVIQITDTHGEINEHPMDSVTDDRSIAIVFRREKCKINNNVTMANAKLIVKAVNMHDKLVNAVNDAFCLIGEALIDNSPTEEERETWSSLQDKLRELLLRSEKE